MLRPRLRFGLVLRAPRLRFGLVLRAPRLRFGLVLIACGAMAAAGGLAAAQESTSPGVAAIANVKNCVVALAEQADLSPQEAGVIQNIAVKEGDQVEKDQLLVQLDDGKAQKEQDVAQAKYDAAKAKAEDDINDRATPWRPRKWPRPTTSST